jgi:hypothetical protein
MTRSASPMVPIRNCDFIFAWRTLTIASMQYECGWQKMSSEISSTTIGLRGLIDRLFESLERAKLRDLERLIARASNEREVSQRVHRLESGDTPFSAS